MSGAHRTRCVEPERQERDRGVNVVGGDGGSRRACRMVKNGGIYKNNAKVSDQNEEVREGDLIDGRLVLLAAGKKNKMLVRITD